MAESINLEGKSILQINYHVKFKLVIKSNRISKRSINVILRNQNMKKIIFGIIILLISDLANAQSTEITYKVTNYSINGVSHDKLALSADVSLSFYKCQDQSLCFTNNWRNKDSQSYGGVYSLKVKDIPETNETYSAKEFKFTWNYYNTYDSKRGQAAVTLTNIYIENTVKFTAEIVLLDTNEVLLFKGYLE